MKLPWMWRANHQALLREVVGNQLDNGLAWREQFKRADRLHRHLMAIFELPCDCAESNCLLCRQQLDACATHAKRCAACIAEHALFFHDDHPSTRSTQAGRGRID